MFAYLGGKLINLSAIASVEPAGRWLVLHFAGGGRTSVMASLESLAEIMRANGISIANGDTPATTPETDTVQAYTNIQTSV